MHRNKKGVALPLIAVMLTTLLGIGALVVDLAEGYSLKTRIKNAVDLSVLAGVSQLTDTSSQSITNAKDTALSLLNSNLTMSIVGFSTLTLASPELSIQTGVYDSSTMTFTATESSSSINALKVTYTHTAMTTLGSIFMINTLDISDNTIARKQIAGQMPPGGGFPLAIDSSVLTTALSNSNMATLNQELMTENSYFTTYEEMSANASDITSILDYFEDQTTGTKPPALAVGNDFQINNGSISSVYMSINYETFEGMTYIAPVITVDMTFSNMVQVEGFIGFTITDIYEDMSKYYTDITIIPGYIDNTWSGLTIGSGVGNIGSSEQTLLSNSFGLAQ